MSNKLKKTKKQPERQNTKSKGSKPAIIKLQDFLNSRLEKTGDRDFKTVTQRNNVSSLILEFILLCVAYYISNKNGMQFLDSSLSVCSFIACAFLSAWAGFSAFKQIRKFNYGKKSNTVLIILHGIMAITCIILCIIALMGR